MSKESTISQKELLEAFSYDPLTGIIRHNRDVYVGRPYRIFRKIGDVAGCKCKESGYTFLILNYVRLRAHRVAWMMVHGEWPNGEIDHKDLNRSNNAIDNLRVAHSGKNRANTRSRGIVGLKGVTKAGKSTRFYANITSGGKIHYLGCFKTAVEAHQAYCAAAPHYHGEFARLE